MAPQLDAVRMWMILRGAITGKIVAVGWLK